MKWKYLTLVCLWPFFATAEDWTKRLDLFGDLRFQHEYTSRLKKIDEEGIHREKLRARVGVSAKINKEWRARIRLTGADNASPTSTNTKLTNYASKKNIYFDLAEIEWQPLSDLRLILGKQENPLRTEPRSQLIYDNDFTPEGLSVRWDKSLFVRGAAFVLDERSPDEATGNNPADAWLLAGLIGFQTQISSEWRAEVAAGYHHFLALKGHEPFGGRDNFLGNSFLGDIDPVYANEYRVGEVVLGLTWRTGQNQWRAYVDAIHNFSISNQNEGLLAGMEWNLLGSQRPKLTLGYAYQGIGKDATVSLLNNSYFGNGLDGGHGHVGHIGFTVAENTQLDFYWYRTHLDNDGNPFVIDKGLAELQVRF